MRNSAFCVYRGLVRWGALQIFGVRFEKYVSVISANWPWSITLVHFTYHIRSVESLAHIEVVLIYLIYNLHLAMHGVSIQN